MRRTWTTTGRYALAIGVAGLAPALTQVGGIGRGAGDPQITVTVSAAAPTDPPAAAPTTITYRNAERSRSTSALEVTVNGGFALVADGCTGRALGPGKACSVTVAWSGPAPTAIQRGTVTLKGRTDRFAPVVTPVTVEPANRPPSTVTLSPAAIAELVPSGVIGTLTASDPDPGDTHTFVTMTPGFVVNGTTLETTAPLDHESTPTVDVTVTATDSGGLSTTSIVTVAVLDVNEPLTGVSVAVAGVPENSMGAPIGAITLVDPDLADSYTFTTTDARLTVVDGVLRLRDDAWFDFETDTATSWAELTATDAGGHSATVVLAIPVIDVNEAPFFSVRLVTGGIPENTPGATAGTVTAFDPDAGDTVRVSVDDPRFELVNRTLKLRAGIALDYETAAVVSVRVTGTDRAGLTTVRQINIPVANLAD